MDCLNEIYINKYICETKKNTKNIFKVMTVKMYEKTCQNLQTVRVLSKRRS